MDRHHPHAVVVLGLGGGHGLVVLGGSEGDEVEKAAQVAALVGLELARHPHQLANVGEAKVAGAAHQDREVVAGAGHRSLDQLFEREPGTVGSQGRDPGTELVQSTKVVLGDLLQPFRLRELGLPGPDGVLDGGPKVASRPAARRRIQSVSGSTPQAGEASAPSSGSSSRGLAITESRQRTSSTCCWDQ